MEYSKDNNGWRTFREHWGFGLGFPLALFAVAIVWILTWFENLQWDQWISVYFASQILLVSGAALIVWAKIPVYRSGRYFTFGVKAVPQGLAGYYRWGWRIFLFGVALSLCLLVARQ